jgi:hypothetical protein
MYMLFIPQWPHTSQFIPIAVAHNEYGIVKPQVDYCLDKGWRILAPITIYAAEMLLLGYESEHRDREFLLNKSCAFYATDMNYIYAVCSYDFNWYIVRKHNDDLTPDEINQLTEAEQRNF